MRRCICGPPVRRIRFQPPRSGMSAKPPDTFLIDRFGTPIGTALLVTDGEGAMRALDWDDHEPRMRELLRLQYGGAVTLGGKPAPKTIRGALTRHFAREPDPRTPIPCRFGGPPVPQSEWTAPPTRPART